MNREYEVKKALETLKILNEELPKLRDIFKEKGKDSFNFHSKPASAIGRITGNPSAVNKDAFNTVKRYMQDLEHEVVNKYKNDKEMQESFYSANEKLSEVYRTLFGIKRKSLVSKVVTGFLTFSIITGILFGVNSLTGAAIGFNSAPSGFLGAVLFIGGIAGLFFSLKK